MVFSILSTIWHAIAAAEMAVELDRAIGIVGWSGVGKTTLIERLIPAFAARGLQVSTVKHCHHALALDAPGKDSDRHQQAGAVQTMLISSTGTLVVERARCAPPSLELALAVLSDVDLMLVEGFRDYPFQRMEVWDASANRPPRAAEDGEIAALITDCPVAADFDRPVFRRDDVGAICDFALRLLPRMAGFDALAAMPKHGANRHLGPYRHARQRALSRRSRVDQRGPSVRI